jgi:ABC-type transporter Mla subunit MlaD
MASFYNMPFDDAFSKIQSGMAGMSMPLRQLGIDMTETAVAAFAAANGFDTEFSKMSEAEQRIVRYQYLMKATADAQGDFARTSDSYANSQRRVQTGFETLKAQLGEALLPIASTVSDAIADLLDLLTYQPPETAFDTAEEAMSDAAAQATQAQGILGYMDKLYEKYGQAAEGTDEWAKALERLKEVFPDVNNYIDAESGKLMATNEELRKYIENSKQAAIEDAKKAALAGLSDQYVQAGQQYYTAEINRDMAREQANQAWSDLVGYIASKPGQEGFTGEGMSLEQLQFAAQSVANEFGESQETINEWIRIYNEQTAAAQSYEGEMETLESTMHSLEAQLDIANAALERMSAAAASAASALGGSAGMTSGQYYNWLYSGKGFARGLDYVPSEGFYHLHAGERVQTAAEASLARQYGMQAPGMDYGSIGAAVWQNAPKIGGDVYLDNRIVGQVISASQGRSYRALQRSGWQG